MKRIEWSKVEGGILALVPFYSEDGGNYTQVLLANRPPINDLRKVTAVRRSLAGYLRVDECSLRQVASQITGKNRFLPLAYHRTVVLLPVRMRQVRAKDEGATGYLNLIQVQGFELPEEPGATTLTIVKFNDGTMVECLHTPRYLQRSLAQGRQVLEELMRFQQQH